MKPLTPQREKFAQNLAKGMSQIDARRDAFGQGKYSDKTLAEAASRLAADSKIIARVAELTAPALKKAEVTVERVIAELAKVAFIDADSFNNSDGSLKQLDELDENAKGALQSYTVKTINIGEGMTLDIPVHKAHDKMKALELLGKHLAMFTDKHEHSGTLSLKDFVEQRKQ